MTDFQTALAAFEKQCAQTHDCDGGEVWSMVQREVERRLTEFNGRKTPKQTAGLRIGALASCRGWLDEPRRTLTARDVYRYAPAKNYFNALLPKGAPTK